MSNISIEKELQKSYLEYSLSVIIGRAIPDVRDGLKPVHRRILFAMHELGNTYNRAYKKSARVVGDVIGKFHPHGDSAVYDALVRMAQEFNMRDPLVDGQGNFGSIDGDSAAAMRYTEVRMSRLASSFLADIEKDTVEFRPNYDNSLQEPSVLPTKVPNLLVNGSSGIAVGMATNIPPHNLGEVVDGTLRLLDDPKMSVDELMQYIKAPDFPTGALIYGKAGIREAYRTGRGSVRIRSRIEIEKRKGDLESIVVKEIPYALNKSTLVEKIAMLVNERKIEGISDLRDESDMKGIRIVMDLKKGVFSDVIINQLFKFTSLETSFGINMMAVVNNRPQLLNLKQVLEYFLDYRREVVIRRSRFDLRKAQHRAHILEGLRIALDFIDEVVALIRASKTPQEAKERLRERFGLSDIQAQAILDMRLQRLTNLEREKLLEEYAELLKQIEYLTSIIENPEVLKSVIRQELEDLRETFVTPRKSELLAHDPDSIDIEDIIPDEPVVITLSRNGYLKRTSLDNYRQQRRGGTGITGVQVAEEDFITFILTTSNHQYMNLFSNKGKMYQVKVHQIPEGGRTARGKHVANLLPLDSNEYIAAAMTCRDLDQEKFYFFYTKLGVVKRSSIHLYRNIRAVGLIALGMRDDDELIGVREVETDDEMVLVTMDGYSIRFACSDVRAMGRTATGVKGLALRKGDQVVAGVVVNKDTQQELLTIAENGYGKRTQVEHFRAQSRGGKGIINMRITPKTGKVVGAMMVYPTDELILLTSGSKIIRIGIADISLVGRATQGVRLVRLEDEQTVVCFDHVPTDAPEVSGLPRATVPAEKAAPEDPEVLDDDTDLPDDDEAVDESEDLQE
ncbi:DNA gyrase subunit A [Desulfomicrobium apsheronum]|uniref:DNA gyrase subunit A n=1 Tax=Desulfomicrobium apsheronum TaxID=52560 RepID=A0A1I3MQ47_9BACT|nr:DNA gyrase subunit A [Desulfomicrobium apsheronum]SFI99069.1 DNA gyrase subunit A [Desulfomicrobium apsheronum]